MKIKWFEIKLNCNEIKFKKKWIKKELKQVIKIKWFELKVKRKRIQSEINCNKN